MNMTFINHNQLQISWELHEQILAVNTQKTIIIPLDHVRAVSTKPPISNYLEIRNPGITIPGVIKAGIFYNNQIKEFWYATEDHNYLTLELTDEPWQRIILTIDNNQIWAEKIKQILSILTLKLDDNTQ